MQNEVVRRRNWLSEERFLDLLGATNLIPGPNSTEMAMHIGALRRGGLGLLVAGLSFFWVFLKTGSVLFGSGYVLLAFLRADLGERLGWLSEAQLWGENHGYRVLFATEGRFGQVLLGLHGFAKKTQRTPPREIRLAEIRLRDWRDRRRKS